MNKTNKKPDRYLKNPFLGITFIFVYSLVAFTLILAIIISSRDGADIGFLLIMSCISLILFSPMLVVGMNMLSFIMIDEKGVSNTLFGIVLKQIDWADVRLVQLWTVNSHSWLYISKNESLSEKQYKKIYFSGRNTITSCINSCIINSIRESTDIKICGAGDIPLLVKREKPLTEDQLQKVKTIQNYKGKSL